MNGYISIDLGGTNIACALSDTEMNLVAQSSSPTESQLGPEGVIDRIANLVEITCSENGLTPAGMGIGVPGLADSDKGESVFFPNFLGHP